MIDHEQLENLEYFNYLGRMIKSDERCTREFKFRIVIAKAAFSKKKVYFTSKLYAHIRKQVAKCYIWNVAVCGAETWTLRKVCRTYREILKCGAGEGWRRSVRLTV
jgi:hypothetical protein